MTFRVTGWPQFNSIQYSGGFRGGSGVSMEPPFGLELVLRSTDDRLNGTPSLPEELRNQLLWHTLAKVLIENAWIDRLDTKFLSKTLENGRGFNQKWAWL